MSTKVFAWGTFDLLHEAHKSFLQHASMLGNELHVVVVPDRAVQENKSRNPIDPVDVRRKKVGSLSYVTSAYIDSLENGLKSLEHLEFDIVCVGYDQDTQWSDKLLDFLRRRGQNPTLVRLPKLGDIHTTFILRSLKSKLRKHSLSPKRNKRNGSAEGTRQEELALSGGRKA